MMTKTRTTLGNLCATPGKAELVNGELALTSPILAEAAKHLPSGYALSMWLENRHRKNEHIAQCWSQGEMRVCGHFYHVGSSEYLRNEMDEALVIKPGFAMPDLGRQRTRQEPKLDTQLSLAMEKRAAYQV